MTQSPVVLTLHPNTMCPLPHRKPSAHKPKFVLQFYSSSANFPCTSSALNQIKYIVFKKISAMPCEHEESILSVDFKLRTIQTSRGETIEVRKGNKERSRSCEGLFRPCASSR